MKSGRLLIAVSMLVAGGLVPSVCLSAETQSDAEFNRLFQAGLLARKDGERRKAAEAFQAILDQRPELHRARLELALTQLELGEYDLAAQSAQQVLADPGIPPQVRVTVLAFLAKVKADREIPWGRFSSRPSLSVGYLHDNNANAGSGQFLIPIADTNLQAGGGENEVHDNALVLNLNLPHRYSLKMSDIGGLVATRAAWVSEANLYSRTYLDDSAYNLDVLTGITGPELVGEDWKLNLDARLDLIRWGSNHLATFAGFEPEVTLQVGNNTALKLSAKLQDRNYKGREYQGYDSFYRAIGFEVEYELVPNKVTLLGGGKFFSENADAHYLSNRGDEIEIGADWRTWKDGLVYIRLSRENFDYHSTEPVVNIPRYDREDELVLGVDHTFRRGAVKDWTLSGVWEHTRHFSNVEAYEYRRDQTQISMGRNF